MIKPTPTESPWMIFTVGAKSPVHFTVISGYISISAPTHQQQNFVLSATPAVLAAIYTATGFLAS
jgi:hypothetical protein